MSELYTVIGYQYIELSDHAKVNARQWLDQEPLDLDDGCAYVGDWEDEYIQEFCHDNNYVFDRAGRPIHNIVEG
jgi:hypothetical protein